MKTLEIKNAKVITAVNGAILQDEKGFTNYPDKTKIAADVSQQVKKAIEESDGETTISIFIGKKERKAREKKADVSTETAATETETEKGKKKS